MQKSGVLSVLLIVIVVAAAGNVLAQENKDKFDANKGFSWLVDKGTSGNYGSIMATAFAALALKESGVLGHADRAVDYLKSQQDKEDQCWPKGSCKPADTLFALWTLNEFGEKTADGEDWLRSALTPSLKNNWWLQVITAENGTCRVSYNTGNGEEEDVIRVDGGKFPECSATPTKTFLDLNRCLKKKNVLAGRAATAFDVNCQSLGANTVISLVFNTGSTFTLVEQSTTDRSLITVNNGCVGDSVKGSCSKDKSLYGNWIFTQMESSLNVNAWLKEKYDRLKPFDNALMFLASRTDEQVFLDDLTKQQRNDGSFDKDVLQTAIGYLGLEKGGNAEKAALAKEFLESKQRDDGSWEGSTLKTAIVLYSAFTDSTIVVGPPKGGGPGPKGPVCGDNVCEDPETEVSCPKDCQKQQEVCVIDGRCDTTFKENSQNCPADCTCGDNVCDSAERASGSCEADCGSTGGGPKEICGNDITEGFEECDGSDDTLCPGLCQADCTCAQEEASGSWGWMITLGIILLVGVGAFFFFMKYQQSHKKGKGRGNTGKRPDFKPFTSQLSKPSGKGPMPRMQYRAPARQPKSKLDAELDKSIKEAKKLIKKL